MSQFAPQPLPPSKEPVQEERTMAMLAHLSVFVLGIIGPVIIMLIKKDSKFVEDHAKEALNFQLTMLIIMLATCAIGAIVCIPMLYIFSIIAALDANKGLIYRYPFTFRMVT